MSYIVVVDDFHKDPDAVRNAAISSNYPDPGQHYTYPGRNSSVNVYDEETHKKFEILAGKKLIPAKVNGYFRLSLEKDSYKQDIHVDPNWEYGAVCYLNTPDQVIDEGGTSFWKHNSLQIDHLPNSEESRSYGWSDNFECWNSMVYTDGLDRSKWTRYFLCPMRYNRLVFFTSSSWHSHNYNFGTDINNGRLVQLFFFNPTKFGL